MRHRKAKIRLSEKPAHARMLCRNLVTSLILYESVRTTKKRAKVIQPMIDRIINAAKKNQIHTAIMYINRTVTDENASRKIMEVLKERFRNLSSGLTVVSPAGARKGDGAELVDISLADGEKIKPQPEKEKSSVKPSKKAKQ